MSIRRLVFILLAAICLMSTTGVSAATACQYTEETLGRTDNCPQWHDMGMSDVLAVTNGSTVAPPNTVRVIHDSPAGTGVTPPSSLAWNYGIHRQPCRGFTRSAIGYIYLIRCLRL